MSKPIERYGVNYIKYWFNAGKPADAVHKEVHGLGEDEITEVKKGS